MVKKGRTAPETDATGEPDVGSPAADLPTTEEGGDLVPAPGPDEEEPSRASLAERLADRVEITLPVRHNPGLRRILEAVNGDDRLYTLWVGANVTAVDRLHMSDHGPVHTRIVANSALRILRLLMAGGVTPSIVSDYGLEPEDAEIVVALAALFHDVGMSIHREGHEDFSLFVAQPILDELLGLVYEPGPATLVRAEVQHAIISHRSGGKPLTVEGGVLRVADALDMAQGRSRIPFQTGSTSIHSVSAAAIEAVHIEPCDTHAVRIRIQMTNSAGVFQVDELLGRKLRGSGLEEHVLVEAVLEGESEKRLVQRFRL